MKIKRTIADALFSNYVRARDKWTCQKCLKTFPKGAQNLHSAHIFSRRHWATRHDPENALALCFTCHQSSGSDPISWTRWCDERFGKEAMDRLAKKAHSVVKKSKQDEADRVKVLRELIRGLE